MVSKEENDLLCCTGPGTAMGNLFRRFWLPVALSRELPKPDCPPVRVRILSEDLIMFRDTNGKVGLLSHYCPHRGASLFFGRNEENGLRCVYHGWKFDVNGECVDMPNEPVECSFKQKIRPTAYPTREAGGVIWAYMGPQQIMPELPQLEWTLVPQNHVYVHKRFQHCNYLQNVEGEVDSSHVSFLDREFRPEKFNAYQGDSQRCSFSTATNVRMPNMKHCHCGTGAPCPGEGHRAAVFGTGNGVRTGNRCASQLGRGPILLACN